VSHQHLLVIGAQRCGTTYLRTLLDEHPAITMTTPAQPEPKVFLDEAVLGRGREWYVETWFPRVPEEMVLGEKSTSYLELPAVIDRVREVLGAPRVLVQLRDPVARAVSNWRLSVHHGLETRDLATALSANLEGPEPWDATRTSVSPYTYLERGRYAELLRPWHEAFPDGVRVQFLEDLLVRPREMSHTYRWLGVQEDFVPSSLDEPINRSAHDAPPVGSELTARLRDWFAESDRELAELLGRPVPWPTAD